MPDLKLWLVRHGETTVNAGLWSASPADTHLTCLGKEQAKRAATQVSLHPDLFVVSPLVRARETMIFFSDRWPDTPISVLAIQEFIYLSPARMARLEPEKRKEQIETYWQRKDPNYCDGGDAESFASFLQRVSSFYQQIRPQQGFVVAVGHGQFFKAFQLGLRYGFIPHPSWMQLFREQETTTPMKNGDIVQLEL